MKVRNLKPTTNPAIPGGRADGFIELSWYSRFKHMATAANAGRGWDIVLTGPASSGKTTAGYMLAHDLGYDVVVQQCHRRVEVEDFKGTRSIVPGKGGIPVTGFDPGTLTRALLACAEARGVVYIIDEINLVDPSMLAILNNLTQRDQHSAFVVPEMNTTIPRPANFILIGTMNPEYVGTNQLSEAFVSRIVKIECPMMSLDEISKILNHHFPNESQRCKCVSRLMGFVESARKKEQHQWEPDLRTMLQLIDLWICFEPNWSIGQPLNRMAEAFDATIGPKIGWCDTYFPVRRGLRDAIVVSLGGKLSTEDDTLDVGNFDLVITGTDDD